MTENNNEENKELKIKNKKFFNVGFFFKVPVGYVVVLESFFQGKVKVADAGFHSSLITTSKTLISNVDNPIDYKKEKFKSRDGYEIWVDTALTYKIVNPVLFYKQESALEQLNIKTSSVLRRLIAVKDHQEVSQIRINLRNLDDDRHLWIKDEFNEFREIYGVEVEDIAIQNVELSPELTKSLEEDTLNRARNQRALETAETNKKIAELRAESAKIHGMAEAEVEAKKLESKGKAEVNIATKRLEQAISKIGGIDTPEKLKALRDIMIADHNNFTVFENNGANSDISKLYELLIAKDVLEQKSNENKKQK